MALTKEQLAKYLGAYKAISGQIVAYNKEIITLEHQCSVSLLTDDTAEFIKLAGDIARLRTKRDKLSQKLNNQVRFRKLHGWFLMGAYEDGQNLSAEDASGYTKTAIFPRSSEDDVCAIRLKWWESDWGDWGPHRFY